VLQGGSVLGGWWVMTWVRQYSALNIVGARKLKAFIYYTVNPFFYEKWSLCVFEPLSAGLRATYTVHLRLIGKLIVNFLLGIIELFSLTAFVLSQFTHLTDRQMDRGLYDHQHCIAFNAVLHSM